MAAEAKLRYNINDDVMDRMIDQLRKAGREAGMTQKDIDRMVDSVRDADRKGSPALDKFNKKLDGIGKVGAQVGKILAAAWAIDQIRQYGGEIIEVTKRFQTLQAVLETTLGSSSAADAAFSRLQKWAAVTPFQVDDITDAFTRLASDGFVPTNKELTKLGDLSSSRAKSLIQLTEAILDATTMEFERLKEFGIKARQAGDEVSFTFRGVTTTVDKTADSIREYILGLGDLEGISGSMANISATLQGKISNMDDSFDALFFTIGQGSNGPLSWFIEKVTLAIEATNDFLKSTDLQILDEASEKYQQLSEKFDKLKTIEEVTAALEDFKARQAAVTEEMKGFDQVFDGTLGTAAKYADEMGMTMEQLQKLSKSQTKAKVQVKAYDIAIDDLTRRLRVLQAAEEEAANGSLSYAEALKRAQQASDSYFGRLGEYQQVWDEFVELQQISASVIKEGLGEAFDNIDDEIVGQNEAMVDAIKAKWASLEEFYLNVGSQAIDGLTSINDELFYSNQAARDREMEALEAQRDQDLQMAGENERRKQQVREDFARKAARLRNDEAQARARMFVFEKLAALGETFIKTRLAVAQAVAASPLTFGEPWATYARIQGGISAGIIGAQTLAALPQFKDGVVDFRGKGTERSDDNLVRISNRESIMTALGTKKFKGYLEAMNDPSFTEADLMRMVMKKLPPELMGHLWSGSGGQGVDLSPLEAKMDSLERTMRRKETATIIVDSEGSKVNTRRGQQEIRHLEDRFGIKIR